MKPEAADFLRYLGAERNDSPNTVKAYGRDIAAFEAFLDRHYAGESWTWAGVDRLAMRGFLADAARRGCTVHPGQPMLAAQIDLMIDFMAA